MKEMKWVFDVLEKGMSLADCACTSSGPDISNPVCQYVTDHLIVVRP
jgi:hypothetical protein